MHGDLARGVPGLGQDGVGITESIGGLIAMPLILHTGELIHILDGVWIPAERLDSGALHCI